MLSTQAQRSYIFRFIFVHLKLSALRSEEITASDIFILNVCYVSNKQKEKLIKIAFLFQYWVVVKFHIEISLFIDCLCTQKIAINLIATV